MIAFLKIYFNAFHATGARSTAESTRINVCSLSSVMHVTPAQSFSTMNSILGKLRDRSF